MRPLRLAWIGLLRHWPGAAVAVVCLGAALAAGGIVVTLTENGARSAERLETPFDAIIGPKSDSLGLVLEALALREPSEDVIPYSMYVKTDRRLSPRYMATMHVFARHRGAYVVGTEDAWLKRPDRPPEITEGRWFTSPGEAVVGVDAARRLGVAVGDDLPLKASPSQAMVDLALERLPNLSVGFDPAPRPFEADALDKPLWQSSVTVVGLIENREAALNDAIYVSRAMSQTYHDRAFAADVARKVSQTGATTYVLTQIHREGDWPELKRYVHQGSTVQIVRTSAELEQLAHLAGRGRQAAAGLGLLVIVLACLAVGVTLNARFDGLKPRLGLLRALGYRRREIASWLVFEGLLVTILAVALAVAIEALVMVGLGLPARVGLDGAWPVRPGIILWLAAPAAVLPAVFIPLIRLYRTNLRAALHGL